jgi:hypothetical protein
MNGVKKIDITAFSKITMQGIFSAEMSNPLEMMLIYCSFKGDDCFLALL